MAEKSRIIPTPETIELDKNAIVEMIPEDVCCIKTYDLFGEEVPPDDGK